jgi:hypothetical protein
LHEDLLFLQIVAEALIELIELFGADGGIHRTPPDFVGAAGVFDDKFIVWGAPRMAPGVGDEGPTASEARFTASDGLLVEGGGLQVPVSLGEHQLKLGRFFHKRLLLYKLCYRIF